MSMYSAAVIHCIGTHSGVPGCSDAVCDAVQQTVPGRQDPEVWAGGAWSPLNVRITTSVDAPEIGSCTLSYCASPAPGHVRPRSSFLRTSCSVKYTSESSGGCCRSLRHVGQSVTGCATYRCKLTYLAMFQSTVKRYFTSTLVA